MQQGFQELSKEEKEALAQKRMDDMRRKNEELLKRHEEIEADKKNADLSSSSAVRDSPKKVPPVEASQRARLPHRDKVQRPRPLRQPHAAPTDRAPQNKWQTEEKHVQRLSADDHPPPDPEYRFLADRMREQDDEEGGEDVPREDGGKPRGTSQRHRRNYGGRDFENVGPTMRHQRDLEREYPESLPRNPAVHMTGRQRREHEQWKCDRERIDQERMQRHTTATGEFKREWDHNKQEQEDLPPPRKYEEHGQSYGSRVFSRGGQRGRGSSRGSRRGGRQETPRSRTESSSSARSDLSSEPDLHRDGPYNAQNAVPLRDHVCAVPPRDYEKHNTRSRDQVRKVPSEEHDPAIETSQGFEHSGNTRIHDQPAGPRTYGYRADSRNYDHSFEPRNHDKSEGFCGRARGRGRGRGDWEPRGGHREHRRRDWVDEGHDPRDRVSGSRGSQPRRRGRERRGGGERNEGRFPERTRREPYGSGRGQGRQTWGQDVREGMPQQPSQRVSAEEWDTGGGDAGAEWGEAEVADSVNRTGGEQSAPREWPNKEKRGHNVLEGTPRQAPPRSICAEEWDANRGGGGAEWGETETVDNSIDNDAGKKADELEEGELGKDGGGSDDEAVKTDDADEGWEDCSPHLPSAVEDDETDGRRDVVDEITDNSIQYGDDKNPETPEELAFDGEVTAQAGLKSSDDMEPSPEDSVEDISLATEECKVVEDDGREAPYHAGDDRMNGSSRVVEGGDTCSHETAGSAERSEKHESSTTCDNEGHDADNNDVDDTRLEDRATIERQAGEAPTTPLDQPNVSSTSPVLPNIDEGSKVCSTECDSRDQAPEGSSALTEVKTRRDSEENQGSCNDSTAASATPILSINLDDKSSSLALETKKILEVSSTDDPVSKVVGEAPQQVVEDNNKEDEKPGLEA